MKKYKYSGIALIIVSIATILHSCTKAIDDLELASFPTTAEVFIDGFPAGLNYAAFGGSDVAAFDVDYDIKYEGSASMRFEIPDFEAPEGAYAGGAYYSTVPRDLSNYTVLSFWAKASKAASVDVFGFGNDLGDSKYLATINGVAVNTNWKKYYIPLPDPSKLTQERGMFFYSEGPEDGTGYTLWVDEVKFEKLNTIAHGQASIVNGESKDEVSFSGMTRQIDGLSYVANLPSGINQTVSIAPSYFNFSSSDTLIAKVNKLGLITVLNEGTAQITAKVGNTNASGSLNIKSVGNFTHAEPPTKDAADVISVFSNAYTNHPVDFYNGYWEPYQTTLSNDFDINDDDILYYTNLNFVGIQFSSPTIDASNMDFLHIDIMTKDAVTGGEFTVKIVDFGADDADGGSDDSNTTFTLTPSNLKAAPNLVSDTWISLEIPLSGLASKTNIGQIIFESNDNFNSVFVDNIYFYTSGGGGTPTAPSNAAPTPTNDATDVISIYSDAYTPITGTNYNPGWGQTTVYDEVQLESNNTMFYSSLDYQGIVLGSSQNVTNMEFLHIDVWTANSTALNVYLISTGPVETAYAITVPTTGWSSLEIPLSSFTSVDLADVIQLKFDGNGNIYLDNIYFYKTGGGSTGDPTTAAPTPPTRDVADVISIYSDTYTNISVDNFDAGWCGGAATTEVQIAGNNTLKKNAGVDCHGIDFSTNRQDLSAFTHIHFDFYTNDADLVGDVFNLKLVDFAGGSGEASALEVNINTGTTPGIVAGQWVSVDVDITALTGVVGGSLTRGDIAQIGITTANLTNVWYDNIYFYKSGGGTPTEPTTAAPNPTHDAADVYSIFSDHYTSTAPTTFSEGWGDGTVSDFQIGSDNIKKYADLNFQAIALSSTVDLSNYTHIHIDVWTPEANKFGIKLQDFGPDNTDEYPNNDDSEMQLESSTTQTAGTWVGHDFAIADFTGLTGTANLGQIQVLLGSISGGTKGTAFIDNLYLYDDGSAGGGGANSGPTTAAPTPPTRDAADVVSIYSDAYTSISMNNFDAGWCGGAATTEVQIAGNNTLKKNTGIDCHGIDFSNNKQDLSSYTHIHFDIYTTDTDLVGDVFNVKLVDFGGGNSEASALEVNINTGTTPAIQAGVWVSIDIDITSLGGVVANSLTRSDVAQIGITTANLTNVWYDNIYLYK